MAEEKQPRPGRHGGASGVHDLVRVARQDRHRKSSQRQAKPLSGTFPAPVHGAVFVIGQQDFAWRGQCQARGDEVDRCRHIGGEDQAARVGVQIVGQGFARVPEVGRHFTQKKIHRLFRESAPQLRDAFEDDLRQGSERTRVEIGHAWVEQHGRAGLRVIPTIGEACVQAENPSLSRLPPLRRRARASWRPRRRERAVCRRFPAAFGEQSSRRRSAVRGCPSAGRG